MAAELLVENRIDDGQRFLEQLVEDGFKIEVAFWIKTVGEGLWHLYVASPSFEPGMAGEVYSAVYSSLSKAPESSLQLGDIKLLGATNPIAREAIAVRNRFEPNAPFQWFGERLGNLSFDEAWIYPALEGTHKRFAQIKRRYPDARMLTVPVPNPGSSSLPQEVVTITGKINQSEFEGNAPGTLLFMGLENSSRAPQAQLVFIHRPEGWNKMFRADTNTWEEVIHVDTGKKLYEEADFGPLDVMKHRT